MIKPDYNIKTTFWFITISDLELRVEKVRGVIKGFKGVVKQNSAFHVQKTFEKDVGYYITKTFRWM